MLSLRGDRRTLGLVFVVPALLIYLFSEVFPDPTGVAPVLLGVIVFILTYILTAIGFLRERTAGTLERILVSPASRTGVVSGYVLGFGVLATVQSGVLLGSAVYFLDIEFEHGVILFFAVELLGALSALGLGILLSLFAENEFQALQFLPVVIAPQVILGGTFIPIEELPDALELLARAMPITYILDAMNYVVLGEGEAAERWSILGDGADADLVIEVAAADFWVAVVALCGFTLVSIAAAGVVMRRAG
ncbi:ABC transporter [Halococcus saccharolyticus DSM 5350]|uniref:ABC transporter n=1 Tax=Halococcus saccharolyticus DSM 5350 TaxID=1227455 RepID=M0MHB2_9EURY|nr:ABC transporter [Halococcus saccharolyticus DSM 5350]